MGKVTIKTFPQRRRHGAKSAPHLPSPNSYLPPRSPSAELRSAIGRVLLGKYAAQDILDICAAAQLHANAMDGHPVIFAKETTTAVAGANSARRRRRSPVSHLLSPK